MNSIAAQFTDPITAGITTQLNALRLLYGRLHFEVQCTHDGKWTVNFRQLDEDSPSVVVYSVGGYGRTFDEAWCNAARQLKPRPYLASLNGGSR